MMKRILYLIPFLPVILSISCGDDQKTKISGNIENGGNTMIYFSDPLGSIRGVNDSVKVKSNGDFSYSFKSHKPEFIEVVHNNKKIMLIAHPGEKIELTSTNDSFATGYSVKGSKDSEDIRELNLKLHYTLNEIDSLKNIYISDISDEEKSKVETKIDSIYKNHKKFLISFVLRDLSALSNVVALYQRIDGQTYFLNSIRDLQYFKIVTDSLQKYYPNISYVQSLNKSTSDMIARYNTAILLSKANKIETTLPEIILPDTKGDSISLSSLKGKTALLLFWSPLQETNLAFARQLIPIYNKYKKKGFEIYQVAFEVDTKRWSKIIKFEEIPWINVCDDNGNMSSYLTLYNLSQLPTSFLIDSKQENILGKDLSVRQIDLKLNYILNKK